MERAGVAADDVSLVRSPSGQPADHRSGGEATRIRAERTITNIDHYGNTSSASIPLALFEAVEDGRVQPRRSRALLGIRRRASTWGSALLRWGRRDRRPRDRAGRLRHGRVARHRSRDRGRARAAPVIRSASATDPTRPAPTQREPRSSTKVRRRSRCKPTSTDTAAVDAAFSAVESEFGRITILVNNAGISRDGLRRAHDRRTLAGGDRHEPHRRVQHDQACNARHDARALRTDRERVIRGAARWARRVRQTTPPPRPAWSACRGASPGSSLVAHHL